MDFDLKRHEATKLLLKRANTSLSAVAEELGVSPGFVTKVSQGWNTSKRVQEEIARRVNMNPSEIWPSRYDKEEDA